jgi:hypothetical protein
MIVTWWSTTAGIALWFTTAGTAWWFTTAGTGWFTFTITTAKPESSTMGRPSWRAATRP